MGSKLIVVGGGLPPLNPQILCRIEWAVYARVRCTVIRPDLGWLETTKVIDALESSRRAIYSELFTPTIPCSSHNKHAEYYF